MGIERPEPRLTQLDGLRGLAALIVVFYHYTTRYHEFFLHTTPPAFLFQDGRLGVNLFFGVSGFVIFMTLDRARVPMDFVVSRFSRLYPAYWAAVALTFAGTTLFDLPGLQVTPLQAAANFTMLHDFFSIPHVDGVYWTLVVELIFYGLMLIAWALGLLRRPVLFCGLWLALAFAVELTKRVAGIHVSDTLQHMLLTHYIPWFAIGMMAYVTLRDRQVHVGHALVVALAFGQLLSRGRPEVTLGAIMTLVLVFAASRGALRVLAWRPLLFVGVVSYPLYLLHQNLGFIVIRAIELAGGPTVPAMLAAFAVTLALAAALHYGVESPASRWIRSRYRERAPRAPRAPAFARARWAAGTAAVMAFLAVSLVVTARLKHGDAAPQVAALDPLGVADHEPCVLPSDGRPPPVIVVLGQSDSSNVPARAHGESLRLFADRGCLRARDPLPNTPGGGASIWSALQAGMRKDPSVGEIIIAPLAADLPLGEWLKPGPLHTRLHLMLTSLHASKLRVAAVIWEHGQADTARATPAIEYRDGLLALRRELDVLGIDAPLLLAKSTLCARRPYTFIRRAIDQAIDAEPRLKSGPDLDELGAEYRSSDCRFNAQGREAASKLWHRALAPLLGRAILTSPGDPPVAGDLDRSLPFVSAGR